MPKLVCSGCGSTETIEELRARVPTALSCCPERKMVSPAEAELEKAEAEVARLKREIMTKRCGNRECNWKFVGCRPCSCEIDAHTSGGCSIPVHECVTCKDSDYGQNAEAKTIREECSARRAEGDELYEMP